MILAKYTYLCICESIFVPGKAKVTATKANNPNKISLFILEYYEKMRRMSALFVLL